MLANKFNIWLTTQHFIAATCHNTHTQTLLQLSVEFVILFITFEMTFLTYHSLCSLTSTTNNYAILENSI